MKSTKGEVDKVVKMMLADLKNDEKILQGYAIGLLYFKSDEFSKALKYVFKYLKVKPDSALAFKLQAECYEKLNDPEHALESYYQSISLAEKKRQSKRKIKDRSNVVNKTRSLSKCTMLKSDISSIGKKTTTTKKHPFNKAQGQRSFKVVEVTVSKMSQNEGTFQYMVDNFTTLNFAVCSESFLFHDLQWRIFVVPISQAHRTLGCFLYCQSDSRSHSWSCDAAVEFRLISFRKDQDPYVRRVRHVFCNDAYNWGFQNFILWKDVVNPDNNYIENDCIVLEVNIVDLPQHKIVFRSGQ